MIKPQIRQQRDISLFDTKLDSELNHMLNQQLRLKYWTDLDEYIAQRHQMPCVLFEELYEGIRTAIAAHSL